MEILTALILLAFEPPEIERDVDMRKISKP